MKVVNTFISDQKIPEYTFVALHQLRKTNPEIEIDFICKDIGPYGSFFDNRRINWVPQDSIKSDLINEFNSLSWLKTWGTPNTSHQSPEYFFHRAMERIYYLEAYLSQGNLSGVYHTENDVLIYGDLYDLDETVSSTKKIWLTPMGDCQTTFAFVYIPTAEQLTGVCKEFNSLLEYGDDFLKYTYHLDMVNEMSLLHVLSLQGHFNKFPILPDAKHRYVFDPGSYGQYLGGTNNGHTPGFTDHKHIIGREIIGENITPHFDEEHKKPFVFKQPLQAAEAFVQPSPEKYELFNLHVHSKKLEKFV